MRKLLSILSLVIAGTPYAQKSPQFKFNKVTEADLQQKVYSLDSNANAVVLGDVGLSEIVGNNKDWFGFEYTRHKRVHILNKAGYSQGDVEISLYTNGSAEEKLVSVKAVTYNLENGNVVETKMEKSAIFSDRISKNLIVKKFTLPNIKEGSIIDFEYKTTSDFLFNLEPWAFQGSAPVLWSEYQLIVPEFIGYIFLGQGYHPVFLKEAKDRTQNFTVSDNRGAGATQRVSFSAKVTEHRWVMKDVPELKQERFTSTLKNHIAKLEFQLSEYRYPLTFRQVMQSWPQVTKEMLEDEEFGKQLTTNNNWLEDDIKPVLASATTQLEKAKKIYAFVRDNFVCTNYNDKYIRQQTLKNVLKTKKGNVAEINLLLTAILKHEGIQADPIILSTREHGFTYEIYPVMSRFNYVTCQAIIDGKTYYLDASRPRLGFGKMPYECYNGWARIVNESAQALDLSADSLKERKLSSLLLIADKGKWVGNLTQHFGDYESFSLRNKIKEEGQEAYFKTLQKSFGTDVTTESAKIDSLQLYDAPVSLNYKFTMDPGSDDILYINPLFGEATKENPFKSVERKYPVEMPYAIDETYISSIYIPEGYELEELPTQIKVRLNEKNEGFFEYAIGRSGDIISMRSRIKLDRAFYMPEEYEILREFFNLIVKKQSEQIVLKKKK